MSQHAERLGGFLVGDLAGLVIDGRGQPAGAYPATLADPAVIRSNTTVEIFGYPASPSRPSGAWVRLRMSGLVSSGFLQLDRDESSAFSDMTGFAGTPVVASDDGQDAVVGLIMVVSGAGATDAYAIPAPALESASRNASLTTPNTTRNTRWRSSGHEAPSEHN